MAGTITKSVGKNTLGGGEKLNVQMRTYSRSTHDLSYIWRNTQSAGTLVPFMSEVGLPGDTFEIGLNADVITHPTVGPLFGSFKLQLDVFTIPIRLYNGWLHNNKLGVGLDISKIKLPQINTALNQYDMIGDIDTEEFKQINPSCLLSYLGLRGYGQPVGTGIQTQAYANAIPLLGYMDIFKNYYANKQEDKFYMIGTSKIPQFITVGTGASTDPRYEYPLWSKGIKLKVGDVIRIYPQIPVDYTTVTMRLEGEWKDRKINLKELGATSITSTYTQATIQKGGAIGDSEIYVLRNIQNENQTEINNFPLKEIDEMRDNILHWSNTTPYLIDISTTQQSYAQFVKRDNEDYLNTRNPQFGLCLKTYQSDINNNWINTEWIDGAGGINEITAIDTSSGSFNIDTLNLANKVYNMLNRIAISGGTYRDWIETVYTNNYIERAETPVYEGGMSQEIVFQEVVSNAASEDEPLGTLAGRGKLAGNKKGGFIKIKIDEPSYIMGIVSITPRIDYSQGNKWDMRLETLDDLHKPALDAIGFQDLTTDGLAYWSTKIDDNGVKYTAVGKQPAWLNYMTNVNKTYGNFALRNNESFMVLNRNYEMFDDTISDLTTYIDPQKFNYIFADTSLDSMNFWTQIGVNIKARRKMSAKVIPNL